MRCFIRTASVQTIDQRGGPWSRTSENNGPEGTQFLDIDVPWFHRRSEIATIKDSGGCPNLEDMSVLFVGDMSGVPFQGSLTT